MRLAVDQWPKPQAQIDAVMARLATHNRPADAERLKSIRSRVTSDYAPAPL
jgi:hypothetical protein